MANTTAFKSRLKDVMAFMNIGVNPNATLTQDQIFPVRTEINKDGDIDVIGREEYPSHLKPYIENYLNGVFKNLDYTSFLNMCKDLDRMSIADSYNARALQVISQEVVQADTNMQPIFVEADSKQKKFILDFFNTVNVNKYIEPTAYTIAKYGNAIWVLEIGEKGITSISTVDIFEFQKRLEFNLNEIEEEINNTRSNYLNYYNLDRIRQYITSIEDSNKTASEFKDHLLGFQIKDKILPPWRCLHFRNFSMDAPFKKFRVGKPLYIHAISAYKRWEAAKTFETVANMANLPIGKHIFSFKTVLDPAEKFKRMRSAINNLKRLGLTEQKREERAMTDEVYTITDAYDFDLITPSRAIAKLENDEDLREERIVSTLLPRFIIDPRDSGFGEGGTTLVQKWREFARLVFHIQSIILEQLTQLVKIHMILSGEFSLGEIDFTLSMPYPESKNEEMVETQNNLIDLATNILNFISEKLLGGGDVPEILVFEVFEKLNIFDQSTIETWKKHIKNQPEPSNNGNDSEEDDKEEDQDTRNRMQEKQKRTIAKLDSLSSKKQRIMEMYSDPSPESFKRLKEEYGRKELFEEINNIVFKQKQEFAQEYLLNNKHVYSSRIRNLDFDAHLLREWVKLDAKKLKEGEKIHSINCEEKIKVYKIKKKKV